jgi:hypothetical protein
VANFRHMSRTVTIEVYLKLNMLFLFKNIFPFPVSIDQKSGDFFYNRDQALAILPLILYFMGGKKDLGETRRCHQSYQTIKPLTVNHQPSFSNINH